MNKQAVIVLMLIFMLIYSFGISYSQTRQYQFRHLSIKDGLSSHYVYCMAKDSGGFIWFGTSIGLNRFDGYDFKQYKYNPDDSTSLSSGRVRSILEIDDQLILIGTSRGLDLFNPYTEKFRHFKHDAVDPGSLSNNRVKVIYKDQQETIWIGTKNGLNIFDPLTGKFKVIKQNPGVPGSKKDNINAIFHDNRDILWIATNDGLFQFDAENLQFRSIELGPRSGYNPKSNRVNCIAEDPDGLLWIGTSFGLFTYDCGISKYYGPPEIDMNIYISDINMVSTKPDDQAWIATNWGLFRYDFSTNKFSSYYAAPSGEEGLSSNLVNDILIDANGLLWASTYGEEVNIINLQTIPFRHFQVQDSGFQHSGRSFMEDSEKNIWAGSCTIGLLKYDSNMNLEYYARSYRFSEGGEQDNLRIDAICEDSDHIIWVGTGHRECRISTFNIEEGIYQGIDFDTTVSFNTPVSFNEILEDDSGTFWLASNTGLFYMPKGSNWDSLVHIIDHELLSSTFVHDLHQDGLGNIWIAADSGLFCMQRNREGLMEFIEYTYDKGKSKISIYIPTFVHESKDGTIWIGGRTLCKADREKRIFRAIDSEDDLIGRNMIISMAEDKKGYLWLSTWKGLVRYDPSSKSAKPTRLFDLSDGLPYDGYFRTHMYQNEEGCIFMPASYGTQDGFYFFNPNDIPFNTRIPQLVITDLKIHNKPFVTDSCITKVKHLQLSHHQNYLSFEFAVLDYSDPEKNQYAYKLYGVDKDWVYSENRRFVNYSGLSPGQYTFHVKGSNNDGLWNEEGTSLFITILPPPWKTWWAYSLYAIALLTLIYTWRKYDLKRQGIKQELEVEKIQIEKLEELDSMKSRFFANISHEFRTPLTLILGPLEKLRNTVSSDGKRDLDIMQRNARRLQQLINQLLSLSKLESGRMKLQSREMNLVKLVNGYVQSFESLAKQKNIKLEFDTEETEIMMYIDRDKLEKILYNLLSNAFKFTPAEGRIGIRLKVNGLSPSGMGDSIIISVSDTGHGISPDKLLHIFDRFYQADDSYTKDQEGTGIGLALVKELVEIHHGQIHVASEEGMGSTFSILLPLGKDHLKEEEISKTVKMEKDRDILNVGFQIPVSGEIENVTRDNNFQYKRKITRDDEPRPLILIVEDNADLRDYIIGHLEYLYDIVEARDGKEGKAEAIKNIPDLILSDVMMPKMDGFELCKLLKSDERTSHIPVILLTARAAPESKITGLETGADDFLTKPFDPTELLLRIRNLIEQRKKLTERFLKEIGVSDIKGYQKSKKNELISLDHKFLGRAKSIVEKYLADETFDITTFSSEMHLSRTQLHRKLRALTNQSATEFIRTMRLDHAASLLRHKTGNISEIALEAGFSNPGYFAECFRKQYGVLPSEFVKNHKI